MSHVTDKGEELGYARMHCRKCGWEGWTDTWVCEQCDAFHHVEDEQETDMDSEQETDMDNESTHIQTLRYVESLLMRERDTSRKLDDALGLLKDMLRVVHGTTETSFKLRTIERVSDLLYPRTEEA